MPYHKIKLYSFNQRDLKRLRKVADECVREQIQIRTSEQFWEAVAIKLRRFYNLSTSWHNAQMHYSKVHKDAEENVEGFVAAATKPANRTAHFDNSGTLSIVRPYFDATLPIVPKNAAASLDKTNTGQGPQGANAERTDDEKDGDKMPSTVHSALPPRRGQFRVTVPCPHRTVTTPGDVQDFINGLIKEYEERTHEPAETRGTQTREQFIAQSLADRGLIMTEYCAGRHARMRVDSDWYGLEKPISWTVHERDEY